MNALSNNMIMVDRKRLKNPNGLILGTPGSGKSFSAKREITNCFLITEDDIIVCDVLTFSGGAVFGIAFLCLLQAGKGYPKKEE